MSLRPRARKLSWEQGRNRFEVCVPLLTVIVTARRTKAGPSRSAASQSQGFSDTSLWPAEWEADLLPVGHFHVMFLLPTEVADITF